MSKIDILHNYKLESIKNGKKIVDEEFFIKGEKGMTIKFYHKEDDNKEKILITGKNGKYIMKTQGKDKEVIEKELDEEELKKELKSPKLKFAKDLFKGASSDKLIGGVKKAGSKKAGSKKSGSKK